MSQLSPHELIISSVELNSLPEIYSQINDLINDPYCSANDISKIISNDPSLTMRLLKLVNSPFYGFPSQIATVTRAIAIIGMQELRDLVLATSVTRMFTGIPSDLVNMSQFWRQSIYCGLVARAIAGRCTPVSSTGQAPRKHGGTRSNNKNGERLFVAGMLHKIGSLVIYKKIPELSREAISRAQFHGEVLYRAENNVIGFNHADVGGELIRQWKLPKNLETAIEHHLFPSQSLDDSSDTAIVHLANLITTTLQSSNEEVIPPLDHKAWGNAGCAVELIGPIVDEANTQLAQTYSLVRCDH
ncbi:MAG: HDOD domain-containing protein [Gammaproteobacteria bacterium]|nr:HDOD domain-containing protein [Gammaproteobacteria bacterium]